MMFLLAHELVACTECRHHFVRTPAPHTLPCHNCGGRMIRVALQVDHHEVAALPMAQPALEIEPLLDVA